MTSRAVIAASYMRKAERALDEAQVAFAGEEDRGSSNRAYYAMHDAAHAALLATGLETPDAPIKTHHTLIAEFGKRLVLSGQIDAAFWPRLQSSAGHSAARRLQRRARRSTRRKRAVEQADAYVAAIQG